ncbi:MAG: hypothetical protein DI569_11570 [Sphingopyxis macrogoltabida]|uniref:TonB-dependent receptor n=1 Tax=Sphingopyxis macrogoltabida TaxID=33050 RepID=A0A2W5MNT8_SPHMC|nr:MAG: hypothetical protein DI569_11570 [Sphingopyxis macrogoltabida]
MNRPNRTLFAVLSGISWLAICSPALAQQAETAPTADAEGDDGADDGIVVTARKREERLQDVPLSISAISGNTIASERLFRISDYSAKIPNFTALQQNTRTSGLYIRGVGGNANNDGAEPGVGLIVDNVFFTHVGFSWLDFVDLDHIELVRGPQGTLLGKNTTIGALIVTTKKPSFDPGLEVEGTLANRNRYEVRANATGPIVGDTLAYRVTFYNTRGDGWARNAFNGRKLLDLNRWAARGQLLFESGNVTNRIIAEHYETSEYNNFYSPFADVSTLNNGTARNGWDAKMRTLFGYTPNYDFPNNANSDQLGLMKSKTNGVSNQLDVEIGDHRLTSVSAWRDYRYVPDHDSDLSPFSIMKGGFDLDVSQLSQEVRLASPTGGAIDYQIGGYFLHEKIDSNNRSRFQKDATTYFLSPLLPASVLDGVEYDQFGRARIDSYALFGQASWHVSDRATLTGGLRYTIETKKASNTGSSFGGDTLPAGLAPFRAALVNAFGGPFLIEGKRTYRSFSWLINPSYKLTDDILAYASVSYGEKSGAANLSALPGRPLLIDPEKSTAYEIGLKTSFADRRGTFNIDFYWNDIKGYQSAQIDPDRLALGTYLGNVGAVRMRGAEFDAAYRFDTRFSLSFSGAYNDAEYRSYPNAPAPVEYGPGILDLSGQSTGAAKWSGQASFNYEAPITSSVDITAFVNQSFRSRSNLLNPLSVYGEQEGYGLTNAGVGIKDPDDAWSVQIWGRNLFDKIYAVGIQSANAVAPFFKIPGDRRTFGVTVKGRF